MTRKKYTYGLLAQAMTSHWGYYYHVVSQQYLPHQAAHLLGSRRRWRLVHQLLRRRVLRANTPPFTPGPLRCRIPCPLLSS